MTIQLDTAPGMTIFSCALPPMVAVLLFMSAFAFGDRSASNSATGNLYHQLAHTRLYVHAESFATALDHDANSAHLQDAAAAASYISSASPEEEQDLSDFMHHRTAYARRRTRLFTLQDSLSRPLGAANNDVQFYVGFTTRCDIRTLLALQKFSGQRVFAHVDERLYLVIGGRETAVRARKFPGVAWVQERDAETKLGGKLQHLLKTIDTVTSENSADGTAFTEIVSECWYDGCEGAAAAVKELCPEVYVHPTLVEAHCPAGAIHAASEKLSRHIAVDHVDVKSISAVANFGGRAIIGSGANASTPDASRVLSGINVSGSIIAVADTGIDMNNCFFYDDAVSMPPYNNSRVVQSYTVFPCEVCGRCCGSQSGANCSNATNACGDYIDQTAHGTHVVGTIAGAGPGNVTYGNGISSGAKIFFQDFEKLLNDSQCYAPGMCSRGISRPTDLFNLFSPAYQAGARVHSNSWGTVGNYQYNQESRATDSFTADNPTFIVLFAAGNSGLSGEMGNIEGTGSCKNCLTVGASQQSDALFRSMQPYVDDGYFCDMLGLRSGGCANPLNNVNRCCFVMSQLTMSLPCCANQTTCLNEGDCSIASGNIRSATNVAGYSGRGPTPDGRFKPDLVAPGDDILSAATPQQPVPGVFTPTSANHCVIPSQTRPRSEQEHFDSALRVAFGTSTSTPLMAGAVEKLRQYFVQGYYPTGRRHSGARFEPAEALVRAVVLASCRGVLYDPSWGVWSQRFPMSPGFFRHPMSISSSPNFFHGFGLPVLDQAVHMADSDNGYRMFFTNGTYTPSSTATAYTITCNSSLSIPLTVVLAWTDPPGSISSQKQLVNDLDLVVLAPDGNPSQIFGNMRALADQINTVERVITRCPAARAITAIVAPGDSLKSSSQKWYLVANGPVKSEITPTALPSYSRGRFQGPVTQSQPCTHDATIVTSLQFNRSAMWACSDPRSEWDCGMRRREFQVSLAQIVGVSSQAFRVLSNTSDPTAVTLILQCSAMINSWQNASSLSLKYVNATMLLESIRSVSFATFDADPILNAFDWSTLRITTTPPEVSITITSYTDSGCTNLSASSISSPNPLVINSRDCISGFFLPNVGQVFLRAISCGARAIFSYSLNPERCNTFLTGNEDVANCTSTPTPGTWIMYNCTSAPAPPPQSQPPVTSAAAPPPSPSQSLSASAVSTAVIVASTVGGAVGKFIMIVSVLHAIVYWAYLMCVNLTSSSSRCFGGHR